MITLKKLIITVAAVLSACVTAFATDNTVTTAQLLEEIIDRESLAVYPSPDYSLKQASSYDRRAVSKDADGWFANFDACTYIREEQKDGRREFVMMDTEGAGAIVRVWMTFPGNTGEKGGRGMLRIYIDDMDEPAICASARDILSGGLLAGAPLSSASPFDKSDCGHNLYYPILYSKHCKVTYETEWAGRSDGLMEWVFYNIDYREYTPGTIVIPFSWEDVKKNAPLAAKVNAALKDGVDNFNYKGSKLEKFEATLLPGESASLKIKGSRAITRLEASLEAGDKEQALRSTVVEMVFDGNSTVWCPIGDLFGTGYRDLHTDTWMIRVKDGLCTSLWVMPFKKECELILHNFGSQTVSLKEGKAVTKFWKWTDRSMYFGANWNNYSRYYAGDGNGSYHQRDINFTRLKGKGVYVGDAIALFDTYSDWWGEGDEKIYVDGETFPSSFGTGTEDYYGYACCRPDVFTGHPFIAQPCGEGNLSVGYTSNSRYRALDRIPFRTSLNLDMELWHAIQSVITYSPTSLWYILPGGSCEMPRQIESVREKVLRDRSEVIPSHLKMVIEGENLQVDRISAGATLVHPRNDFKWSDRYQLLWSGISEGETMTVSFVSPVEGEFHTAGFLTRAADSGIFRIEFNGCVLEEQADLVSDQVRPERFDFGTRKLLKGRNVISFHLVAPAAGAGDCTLGIDKFEFTFSD